MSADTKDNDLTVQTRDSGRGPSLQPPPVITDPDNEYGSNMRRFQGIPSVEVTKKADCGPCGMPEGPTNREKAPETTR